MQVWVLLIINEYCEHIHLARTKEQLEKILLDYACEYWDDEKLGEKPDKVDREQIIKRYFDPRDTGESYSLSLETVLD